MKSEGKELTIPTHYIHTQHAIDNPPSHFIWEAGYMPGSRNPRAYSGNRDMGPVPE